MLSPARPDLIPALPRRVTEQTGYQFTAYGLSHWLVLLVFAAGSAALIAWGRRHHGTARARWFSRAFAIVVITLHLTVQLYSAVAAEWNIDLVIPLHLSDLAGFVVAYALWSHRKWAHALTYYWCLTLSAQALVSPVHTGPDFPHHEFLAFWTMHLLVIWAAIYLTWGLGARPDWRSFRVAVLVTLCWVGVAMSFNAFSGTNYGFLNRKPEITTVLDLFGPWPVYLVPEFALVLTVWALMTLPWTRQPTRRPAGRT
ncbi:conserved hypothetical integral membrane protein TIGR02206 [Amycolatopsis marina]|uniref:Conserved hypothetical integral membrane protein TIGR02206 n=1 Tax=Amycolatopsis marina TaxID=490629 RepID=A0A1I1B0V5_9PSEU|nr:TIGR02206 family membrane protein [Amycolatopsis marina]SFB43266.1 conserved hypothetical integral membrane protein TIGR02206 [Amycolatopsis marina]